MEHLNIKNSSLITTRFGNWPSFHDAEILSLNLERTDRGADMLLTIHHFQMTNAVDEENYYICKLHSITKFKFINIIELQISNFEHQNVLHDFIIKDISDRQLEHIKYEVKFDANKGLEGRFACEEIEVVESTVGIPKGSVYERSDHHKR